MVTDLLRAVLESEPDRDGVAMVDEFTQWTWGGLDRVVDERVAELEATIGPDAGDVAAFVVHQDGESVIEILAHWRMGRTVAPLNPRLTDREIEAARDALSGVESDAQAIVWTSGTTGRARGVELSYSALVANAEASEERLGLHWNDVWLGSLSLAHVGGLVLMTRALMLDSDLVFMGTFDPGRVSSAIDGEGFPIGYNLSVTHLSLVPTQLLRVIEYRGDRPLPERFRLALIGGAHAPASVIERATQAGWPLAVTYGMTEMTSQVATATPAEVAAKVGTVGRPLRGVEVAIAPDGEVLVRGKTAAVGYVGTTEPILDPDGWYHTGDLGRIDDDGDLWITGRRDQRIVSGGYTVDAIEVEELLRAHPAIVDACVVGVPDEEWGEVVGAFVVGVEGEFDLTEADRYASEALTSAKRPRRWIVDHELPLNANGKPDRPLIASLMRDA